MLLPRWIIGTVRARAVSPPEVLQAPMAYAHPDLLPPGSAAQMLELLLYRVLESIGLDVQARRVFRRLLRVHQLIVDRFHMIADCRAGKGQHRACRSRGRVAGRSGSG